MLKGLFGNNNVVRILLFLFVNEKCYGTQIQSALHVPLTPLQKALIRLENDGVIESHYEGKTRIYQFSPSYPLRAELEILLKKAYTLLPTNEKKIYCFIHKPRLSLQEERRRDQLRKNDLQTFFKRLKQTKHLSFSTKSRQGEEQSTKMGKAEVLITSPSPSVLIFQENGHWFQNQIPETAFSNRFRWTLDSSASLITLEHLRYGETNPVFLFHLTPTKPWTLESVDAHLCSDDTYLGNIVWNPNKISFHWRIIGPNKNQHLVYQYT